MQKRSGIWRGAGGHEDIIEAMQVRHKTFNVGYSLVGIAMGLGAASNELDDLPPGFVPAFLATLGIGTMLILVGRLQAKTALSTSPPDAPSESN